MLSKIKEVFRRQKSNTEFRIHKDDIFLVSYPKSGNTWVRFFISIYKNSGESVLYSDIESFIPSIYKSSPEFIDTLSKPRIIKSHHTNFDIYPKILYIARDGRDALVSYYHYLKELKGFKGSFEDFYFYSLPSDVGTWAAHTNAALEYQNQNKDDIVIIKYEDLISNPYETFPKILSFCNLDYDSSIFQKTLQATSFESLKKMQSDHGVIIEGKKINFFRKGQSGIWSAYFTPKVTKDFIAKSEKSLLSLNYGL